MSIHYTFIARDNDMIVFEALTNTTSSRSYKRECHKVISEMDSYPESSRPQQERTELAGNLKIITYFSVVYFGCVVDDSYSEDKAYRFLEDLKGEFSKIYKGNLQFIMKQTNLTPNCYDKLFRQSF